MNVFNKVTLQSLKKNRTRTLVTIIGIMLSAALICAVTTFTSSVQNFIVDYAVYMEGDWHAQVNNATSEDLEKISSDKRVSQYTYSQSLGYSKVESENIYKSYIYVMGVNNTEYFNTLPVRLVSGRLPKNSDEIVLSEHLYTDGNTMYKEGDKITLDIGKRIYQGNEMGQHNPILTIDDNNQDKISEEELVNTQTRTFTVVGICETPDYCEEHNAPGYTAFTVADEKPAQDEPLDIYYKMNNPAEVYSFTEEMGFEATYNRDLLMYLGVSRYESFFATLVSLTAIVIALIMFGSVALIYNAFSISVSERTKQFGLLSSIGATKKQLRKMVLFEALAVSAVGVPLGILVGIGGIGITLMLIGHKFNALLGGVPIAMRVCVTWQSVAIAVIVAIVTVLISAWIPSIRATKVSAVEAIRQSVDIKASQKQVRTSKLTYKLFGLSGLLAVKQFKRNRKKYRATVISLFMSIVLFVSASAFTEYLVDSAKTSMTPPSHDITYHLYDNQLNGKSPDEVLEVLMSEKFVTSGTYVKEKTGIGEISKEYVSDQLVETTGDNGKEKINVSCHTYFVDDAEFKRILKDNNLNEADFYNPDAPMAIVQDVTTSFDRGQQKYVTLDIIKGDTCEIVCREIEPISAYQTGDIVEKNGKKWIKYYGLLDTDSVLEMPYDEYCTEYTLKSAKTIEDLALFMDASEPEIRILYPLSMIDKVLPEKIRESYYDYSFYLKSDDHAASYDNLNKMLVENGFSVNNLSDIAEDNEMIKNIITIIQVFAYGFVILISLISVANVFNTISTNISLRRREFAMLKSVGMTQKGFNKMMNFECLLYGAKALILGLPVSFGVTYLIHLAIAQGYETAFILPLKAIAIAIISVFLVVFVTMMYAMKKIKKDNPIDALKNENC